MEISQLLYMICLHELVHRPCLFLFFFVLLTWLISWLVVSRYCSVCTREPMDHGAGIGRGTGTDSVCVGEPSSGGMAGPDAAMAAKRCVRLCRSSMFCGGDGCCAPPSCAMAIAVLRWPQPQRKNNTIHK